MTRVSIVCSIRNGVGVIGPTLDSVVAQTFRDWELIVVDDGSTDDTVALVRGYAASEPRIRLIPTSGIGRARSLNLAVAEARGEYIANIDADDPSHPLRIAHQLEAFEREPEYAVIATGHIVLIESESPQWESDPPLAPSALIDLRDALSRRNPVNHSSVMMRRSALLQVGGYQPDRDSQIDYDLFVRLAQSSFRIGLLPLKLSSRRLHASQSYAARGRVRYLLSSLAVQLRAIHSLPGPLWRYALIPARFVYGLLPRGLRGQVSRERHARSAGLNEPFATHAVLSQLRRHSVRGAALAWVVQAFLILLRLASLVVLARLLTPADFGLVAMALAVTGLMGWIRGAGLPSATVQRADVNHTQVSTLFWINAVLSLALALLLAALAPGLVWFYGDDRLLGITLVLAAGGFVDGLGLQHQAVLRRRMRFGAIYRIRVIAALASRSLSIAAALLGAGYWALVIHQVTLAATNCAGLWISSDWRPGPPQRTSGLRSMIAFGGHVAGANMIRGLTRRLHDIVVGKFFGTVGLGFYSRAYTLLTLPLEINKPVDQIATAALSRLQDNPERYRAFFRKALLPSVLMGMPIVTVLFVEAEAVVQTFLGPQWTETVPIFRALAAAAYVETFAGSTQWVYMSIGRADRQLRWSIFEFCVQLVALLVGLRWGLLGVAVAVSSVRVGLAPAKILYCVGTSPLRTSDVLQVLWQPWLASWAAAGVLLACKTGVAMPGTAPLELLVGTAIFGVIYLSCWLLLPGGLGNARSLVELARDLRDSTPVPPDDPSEGPTSEV